MRRWLRVLTVGVLTVVLSIDSASACRLFRSRCRPRCRVVSSCPVVRPVQPHCASAAAYGACESVVVVESLPRQCCVPADGSAHAVIAEHAPVVETEQPTLAIPDGIPPAANSGTGAGVAVEAARPATPTPVSEPVAPLQPIAPVSAEKPPAPAAGQPTPVPQPQFKTAAEILAESAEKERLEKAAAEAAKPAASAPQPQFKTAAEILAEAAEQEAAEKAALDAAKQRSAEPPMEQAPPQQPAPKPAEPMPAEPKPAPPKPVEENLFDEGDDEPAARPAAKQNATKAKPKPAQAPVEDLFAEPEAEQAPTDRKPAPASDKPVEEPATEEKTEEKKAATDDDPFANLDADPEPIRRWIDSTGVHETIGRLVEVRADRVRILKTNGRYTTVSMEQLSGHDQAYVAKAGGRLAGRGPARPAATDTALR